MYTAKPTEAVSPVEHLTLSGALQKAKRFNLTRQPAEAEKLLREALSYSPAEPEVLCELAVALGAQGKLEEGLAAIRHALAYAPRRAISLTVKAGLEAALGDVESAGDTLTEALRYAPDMPAARWNRALWLLAHGQWREGWREYEWGYVHGVRHARTRGPQWEGQDWETEGRTLFVHAEQGFGDTLMLWRFLKQARERSRCSRLVVEVQEPLVPLLIGHPYADAVYAQNPDGSTPERYDAQCSFFQLPMLLGLSDPSEAASEPYIPIEPVERGPFRKVGLCYGGNPAHNNNGNRSLKPEDLAPLWAVEGVEWWFLQPDAKPPHAPMIVPELPSWEETRLALSHLDLLISCDTGVAHLAGAMGVPTALLVPKVTDFRWGLSGESTPLYPKHSLFRQEKRGEWLPVVQQVADALAGRVVTADA